MRDPEVRPSNQIEESQAPELGAFSLHCKVKGRRAAAEAPGHKVWPRSRVRAAVPQALVCLRLGSTSSCPRAVPRLLRLIEKAGQRAWPLIMPYLMVVYGANCCPPTIPATHRGHDMPILVVCDKTQTAEGDPDLVALDLASLLWTAGTLKFPWLAAWGSECRRDGGATMLMMPGRP